METFSTPTARDWLRGWTLTYIPNQDEAERLATQLHTHLEVNGLDGLRLSDGVRSELENVMGTAQDENARSPATVVETILSDHLPPEIAEAAAAPLAFHNLNQGKRTLEVDVEQAMPPALAATIEKIIRAKITEDGAARIQTMYEEVGPEGLRRWLLSSN
ncbi:hypothetical protein [Salinibacter altiplanensis]|uniref:hypothetical protein n=1 Tax=Salinibacter altiplanensis TaxID=1803181 RepID=UPI001F266C33|nr:hypothetical protein [Salinibacter altiplanensis]